jgi:hypothetical protein
MLSNLLTHTQTDIARGINLLLSDEDMRTKLIAKGEKQLKNYSWEKTAQ